MGPKVTFVNDEPRNPSPNQPLTTPTARMVAASVLQSGADTVNINSPTGGGRGQNSLHVRDRAVDINRVDGERVSRANPAQHIQDAALGQLNIAEDFGPRYLLKKAGEGFVPVRSAKTITAHTNHIHLGGKR